MAFSYMADAQNASWTGNGTTTNWSDGGNWNTGNPPGPGGNAQFTGVDAIITFITSPTVDVLDIRDGRTVVLNVDNNTLTVASGKSNLVKIAKNSTLTIASGTLNVTAITTRDAIQFRTTEGTTDVGGTFIVGAEATVNVSGRKGFTSFQRASDNTSTTTGKINNSGVINIGTVVEDGITLNSGAALTLDNNKCAVINLGASLIRTSTNASVPTSLTNKGLITHTAQPVVVR